MKKKPSILTSNFAHRSSMFGTAAVLQLEFCRDLRVWNGNVYTVAAEWRDATMREYDEFRSLYPDQLPKELTVAGHKTDVRWVSSLFGRRVIAEVVMTITRSDYHFYGIDATEHSEWCPLDFRGHYPTMSDRTLWPHVEARLKSLEKKKNSKPIPSGALLNP